MRTHLTFTEYLNENSLYTGNEFDKFIKDRKQVENLFIFNLLTYFGIRTLYNSKKKKLEFINTYFDNDKVRIKNVDDNSNDLMILLKAVEKLSLVKLDTLNKITRLLALIKTKRNLVLDENLLRDTFMEIDLTKFTKLTKAAKTAFNLVTTENKPISAVIPIIIKLKKLKYPFNPELITNVDTLIKAIPKSELDKLKALSNITTDGDTDKDDATVDVVDTPKPIVITTNVKEQIIQNAIDIDYTITAKSRLSWLSSGSVLYKELVNIFLSLFADDHYLDGAASKSRPIRVKLGTKFGKGLKKQLTTKNSDFARVLGNLSNVSDENFTKWLNLNFPTVNMTNNDLTQLLNQPNNADKLKWVLGNVDGADIFVRLFTRTIEENKFKTDPRNKDNWKSLEKTAMGSQEFKNTIYPAFPTTDLPTFIKYLNELEGFVKDLTYEGQPVSLTAYYGTIKVKRFNDKVLGHHIVNSLNTVISMEDSAVQKFFLGDTFIKKFKQSYLQVLASLYMKIYKTADSYSGTDVDKAFFKEFKQKMLEFDLLGQPGFEAGIENSDYANVAFQKDMTFDIIERVFTSADGILFADDIKNTNIFHFLRSKGLTNKEIHSEFLKVFDKLFEADKSKYGINIYDKFEKKHFILANMNPVKDSLFKTILKDVYDKYKDAKNDLTGMDDMFFSTSSYQNNLSKKITEVILANDTEMINLMNYFVKESLKFGTASGIVSTTIAQIFRFLDRKTVSEREVFTKLFGDLNDELIKNVTPFAFKGDSIGSYYNDFGDEWIANSYVRPRNASSTKFTSHHAKFFENSPAEFRKEFLPSSGWRARGYYSTFLLMIINDTNKFIEMESDPSWTSKLYSAAKKIPVLILYALNKKIKMNPETRKYIIDTFYTRSGFDNYNFYSFLSSDSEIKTYILANFDKAIFTEFSNKAKEFKKMELVEKQDNIKLLIENNNKDISINNTNVRQIQDQLYSQIGALDNVSDDVISEEDKTEMIKDTITAIGSVEQKGIHYGSQILNDTKIQDYIVGDDFNKNATKEMVKDILENTIQSFYLALKPTQSSIFKIYDFLSIQKDKGNLTTAEVDAFVANLPTVGKKDISREVRVNAVAKPLIKQVFEEFGSDSDSLIKPLFNVNTKDGNSKLMEALKFNNFDVSNTTQLRLKQNETLTQFEARVIAKSGGTKDLEPLEIEKIDLTDDELVKETIRLSKFFAKDKRHGDTGIILKETFDYSGEDPIELVEWMKEHPDPTIIPAFHGTGSLAASMILRYGFKIVDASMIKVGRMLGNGVYFSNILDKTCQYVGDAGFSRRYGTLGYIFETDAYIGEQGTDYTSAGLGGDNIRSAEWCVFNPRAQLKIKKVHFIEMTSSSAMTNTIKEYYLKYPNEKPEPEKTDETLSYDNYLKLFEAKTTKRNWISFLFMDGEIPMSKFKTKFITEFDEHVQDNPLVELYPSQKGTVVSFYTTIQSEDQNMVIPKTDEFVKNDPELLFSLYYDIIKDTNVK